MALSVSACCRVQAENPHKMTRTLGREESTLVLLDEDGVLLGSRPWKRIIAA